MFGKTLRSGLGHLTDRTEELERSDILPHTSYISPDDFTEPPHHINQETHVILTSKEAPVSHCC